MIPYGRQEITEADIEAVVAVLRSDWLTQGPMVPRFEQAVAAYCGASHAVAVNSATSALHIACLALGLGPGDWLWTSPNTFVASANCGIYCGANVDFVDIDPRTYNLCPNKLAEKLAQAQRADRLPKVVVPVHFAGQPCDMPAIHALGQRYGFRILEDASHAIGASYTVTTDSSPTPGIASPEGTWQSREARKEPTAASGSPQGSRPHDATKVPIGSCTHSDITVFSFHPVKIITTGEGGMALTNDSELADRMERLRSHGITRNPERMTEESHGSWYYQQCELGFNYRMTDIQAALGSSQLSHLNTFVARRAQLATHYHDSLANLPVAVQQIRPDVLSSWHLFVARLPIGHRKQVFETLHAHGIGVNVHYSPVHLQPYYRNFGFRPGYCPEAESYYREAITLPLFPALTDEQQHRAIEAFRDALRRAEKGEPLRG